MSGAIPPLPQYVFTVWCSVKAQGQLYLYLLKTTKKCDDGTESCATTAVPKRSFQ
jgi:hypothetical protein